MEDKGLGILELNPNNRFKEWTKVVVFNCDGTSFQGHNKKAVEYKESKIYFRGSVNMRAHFKWINQKQNFNEAEKIVLSGSRAAGIAVIAWVDYLRDMLKDPTKLYGIVDSGIFL